MLTQSPSSLHASDLQRLVSQAIWDRKKAGSDALRARSAERRIALLLDEFAEAVLLCLDPRPVRKKRVTQGFLYDSD